MTKTLEDTPKHTHPNTPPIQFSHIRNSSRPTGVLNPGLTAPQLTLLSTRPLASYFKGTKKVYLNLLEPNIMDMDSRLVAPKSKHFGFQYKLMGEASNSLILPLKKTISTNRCKEFERTIYQLELLQRIDCSIPRSLTCSPNYLILGNIQQFDTSNKEDDFKTNMFVFETKRSVQTGAKSLSVLFTSWNCSKELIVASLEA